MMGVWSDATDGYDPGYDQLLPMTGADGYAGVYHVNRLNGWTGPTGFYKYDMRSPPAPQASKTWEPIHLWAGPGYAQPTMNLAIEANEFMPPPIDRVYELELLHVPKEVTGAPPVGTRWQIPLAGEFRVTVPTYATTDGLSGYQFAFTVSAVPEPSTPGWLAGLLLLAAGLRGGVLRLPRTFSGSCGTGAR